LKKRVLIYYDMPTINGVEIPLNVAFRLLGQGCGTRRCSLCGQRNRETNGPGGNWCETRYIDAKQVPTTQEEVDLYVGAAREEIRRR